MTEVSFHFNAPDKLVYACRLLRKAYLRGARTVVLVEPHALQALDTELWSKSNHDFLPHCTEEDPLSVQRHSPIRLCGGALPEQWVSVDHVLVNPRQTVPQDFAAFSKLIEVVTGVTEDRQMARARWRHYQQAGIDPLQHNLQAGG